jgi:serine phosphatase RsbU (regulator of sigma subunit)/anti-sigma regulatory factor (Ser/Thr protein kinase)
VPLEAARLLRVRERVREYLRMHCASLDDIDDVVLCVEEACANAIQHSGSSDDLEIEMAFEGERLSVRVADRGAGFDVDAFDPHREPDPTALGGRGLYLIAKVMDEVELACNGGTTVIMRRKVEVPSTAHRRAAFVQEAGPATVPAVVDAEKRLFAMLEDLADGFLALDWEWRIAYANPAAGELLRAPQDRLIGGLVYELFPDVRGTDFDEHGRLAMEQSVASHFEAYFPPHRTWYDLRLYPTVSGVSIYFSEINQRKQIEHERDELLSKAEDERAQLQTVLDVLPVAVGITDAEGRVVTVNPMTSRLWRGDAPLPRDTPGYGTYKAWWPDTGEPLEPEDWTTARVLRDGEPILGELIEIERFDLTRGVIISSSVPIKDAAGTVVGAVGVTFHHRTQHLSKALNDVNALIHSTLRVDEIMRRLVGTAALALDADAAAIELREGDEWPVRFIKGLPPDVIGRPLTRGSVISHIVATTGDRLIVADTHEDRRLGEPGAIAFRSLVAVPLLVRGDIFGVLVFLDGRPRAFDQPAVDFADKLGASVSLALENARLYDDLAERERLGAALNDISAGIVSSFDSREILDTVVARAAAAMEADSASICDLDDSMWVPTTAWGMPAGLTGSAFPREVVPFAEVAVQTRRAVAVDDCDSDARVDPEVQRAWGVRAVVVAPLVVRGAVVAGLFLDYHHDAHHFSGAETAFVDQAAAAAAISGALERARLYEREHGIATTLQDALLALPERISGLRFAYRYHSAAEAALVGGDFYDVFELDFGLLGVTVGDMSGKGLDAAVMTSLVKHTVRAHAVEKGKTPADIVRMASRVLHMQSHLEHFATVFFAILDRRDGRLVYCNAGHPAPAILRGERQITELPPNSPLNGAFPDMPFADSETYLETEDVLLLYTDGLVEARRGQTLFGESRLTALLQRCYGLEPEQLVESVAGAVDEFAGGRLNDDLALLALRREELPGPTQQKFRFDADGRERLHEE